MRAFRVYLDSSALKMAVQRRIVGHRRRKTLEWGGQETVAEVVQFMPLDPTEGLRRAQRREAQRLPVVAWLSLQGRADLITHTETLFEPGSCN